MADQVAISVNQVSKKFGQGQDEFYALDDVSAFVWELLDGTRGLKDIVSSVAHDFDVTPDAAQSDVEAFLADLCERGLAELL